MIDRFILWWLIRRRLKQRGHGDVSVSLARGDKDFPSGSRRHKVVFRRDSKTGTVEVWWDGRKLHRCWCTDFDSHQVDNNRRQLATRVVDLFVRNALPVVSA